jgi:hypothetical protein
MAIKNLGQRGPIGAHERLETTPMINLVSPEYNFQEFCRRMLGRDLLHVIEAASTEAARARRNYRRKANSDFRRGSRGHAYCADLKRLISLLMGSIPEELSTEFLESVAPLALHLLASQEIVALRQVVTAAPAQSAKRKSITRQDLAKKAREH